MPRLVWGAAGERFYEAGVDRVVLYPSGGTAAPWNGVQSITERNVGGEAKPVYNDGYKVSNLLSAEEFEATIQAFSAPAAFSECDGIRGVYQGIFVTNQPRKSFGLAYRTRKGNDTQGVELGYKIHLVYGVMATPSERNNQTVGESLEPMELSWDLVTTPALLSGFKPTSHYIIDTTVMSKSRVSAIEDVLYGTALTYPQLPTPIQLLTLMSGPGPEVQRNGALDPRVTIASYWNAPSGFTRTFKVDQPDGPIANGQQLKTYVEFETTLEGSLLTLWAGGEATGIRKEENVIVSAYVRSSDPMSRIRCAMFAYNGSVSVPVLDVDVREFTIPANVWTRIWGLFRVNQTYNSFRPSLGVRSQRAVGNKLSITGLFSQKNTDTLRPYFDGSFPDKDGVTYSYLGNFDSSASIARSWQD